MRVDILTVKSPCGVVTKYGYKSEIMNTQHLESEIGFNNNSTNFLRNSKMTCLRLTQK